MKNVKHSLENLASSCCGKCRPGCSDRVRGNNKTRGRVRGWRGKGRDDGSATRDDESTARDDESATCDDGYES